MENNSIHRQKIFNLKGPYGYNKIQVDTNLNKEAEVRKGLD